MTIAEINKEDRKQLPPGWRLVRLGDICDINPSRPVGFRRAPDALTTFVPMSAVDEHRGTILSAEIRPFSEVVKGYTFFSEGDILFAKITPCMQNGKHAIARGLIDGIGFGSTEFHVIRPRPGVIPEWIHRFICQPHVLSAAANHFTGAVGQQRVPESFLTSLEIPLPSIDEQGRRMHILNEYISAVEKARAAAEARLEAAKALPAAYLRAVFPKTGQELPDGWKWVRLGEVCEFVYGSSLPEIGRNKGTIPVYGSNGVVGYHDEPVTQGPTLIIGRKGSIGKVNYSSGPCWPIDTTYYVESSKTSCDLRCLFFLLKFMNLNALNKASGVPGLNRNDAYGQLIPFPPTLAEQERIAGILNGQMAAAEKIDQTLQQELEAINALTSSLLRRAFTGGI